MTQMLSANSARRPAMAGGTRAHSNLELRYAIGIVVYILLYPALLSALAGNWAGAIEQREEGSAIIQLLSIAVYGPALFIMIARFGEVLRYLRPAWPLLLLLVWAGASIMWSVQPDAAVRRFFALILFSQAVLFVAMQQRHEQWLPIMAKICFAVLVINVISLAIPGVGFNFVGKYAESGSIRGIYPGKNYFGPVLAFSMLVFATQAFATKGSTRRRWAAVVLVSLVMLFFSNSRTPLIGFVGGLGAMWLTRFVVMPEGWQRRLTLQLRAGLSAFALFGTIVVLPSLMIGLLTLLGRDLTLSGRTRLWDYAYAIGINRPMMGAGYKTFWVDKLTANLRDFHAHWSEGSATMAMTANGHNGYLDMWLELGMVGLVCFLFAWFILLARSLRNIRQTRDPANLFHIGVWAYYSIYSITDSNILTHSDLSWFFVTYCFLTLGIASYRTRPRQVQS
ncbi:MAG: O-antigen ligase family protein [Pseudomonadota bacterium]|nr:MULTISPECIES: O-antigen ligase family protein [Sphingobium]